MNKKELGKKGKRKNKAHGSQPLNQSDMNLESIVVRIVKESCNQAHRWNHQAYSCTDYGCFKKNWMCGFRVKVFAGKFEGKRASVDAFHKIGKTEFNQNYRPDRHNAAEHVDSADCSYGCKDTGCSHSLAKWCFNTCVVCIKFCEYSKKSGKKK